MVIQLGARAKARGVVLPVSVLASCSTIAELIAFALKLLQDLISQLLIRNPAKRLGSKAGAEDIKGHPFFENIKWALIRHTTPPFIPKRTNAAGASSPAQKNDNFSTF